MCFLAFLPSLEFKASNVIENNTAGFEGGGIYWNYFEPTGLELIKFIGNSALVYGMNMACFAGFLDVSLSGTR